MASLWSFRFLLWYMCILIVQPQVLFRFLWPWRIANLSMMLCVGLHLIAVAQEGKPLIRMGAATKLGLALFVMSYLSLHIGALQTNTSWNVHIDGLAKAVVVMIMIEATATTIQRVWAIMATIGIASLWWMKAGVRLGMQGATYRGERLMGAATGLTPDPNMFAYMACLMIPLYLYLGKYTTNKWVGWGFRSMVLVCVYIVLDTGSRSGFVMMVVLGLFCVIHYWKEHKKYIVLAIVGITLVLPFVRQSNLDRVLSIGDSIRTFVYGETQQDGVMTQDEHSAMARRVQNLHTWALIQRYPLGGGIGMHESRMPDDLSGAKGQVHNEILMAGRQMGFPGMALYIIMLFIFMCKSFSIYTKYAYWAEVRELSWLMMAQGVAICSGGYFSPSPWNPMTTALCAVAGALSACVKKTANPVT